MINDQQSLDIIFEKAKSTVVCGATVLVSRTNPDGKKDIFEHISNLEDLETFKKQVYKYLKPVRYNSGNQQL